MTAQPAPESKESNLEQDPLRDLRLQQDAVDREIMAALGKRVTLRRQISALRREHKLLTVDPARMQVVLQQSQYMAKEYNVPDDMARQMFELLIEWSHRLDRQWREDPNS